MSRWEFRRLPTLNERITKGNIQQMMLIAEALQEQKIAKIAEQIAEKKDRLNLC